MCYSKVVQKRIRGKFMSLSDKKEVRFIGCVVCFLIGVALYNIITDYMLVDLIYLFACIFFIIRYFYLKVVS